MGDRTDQTEPGADPLIGIAHALDAWYTRLGRQFGPLSRPQRRVLHLVQSQAPIRVGAVAASLGLTTGGATRMLDALAALGYVARERAPQGDQREVYVTVTPAGTAALNAADAVFISRVAALTEQLAPNERDHLARLLATGLLATGLLATSMGEGDTADGRDNEDRYARLDPQE